MQIPAHSFDILLTLAIGAVGAALFVALGFPAPFLTGPALFVSIAALLGLGMRVPDWLRDLCFIVLGIGIGAGITPDVVRAALTWPVSFTALFVVLIVTLVLNAWLFRAVFGFRRDEAFVSSVPGLLSYVLALAADKDMDIARISLVQTLRVMLLTLAVPVMMGFFEAETPAQAPEVEVMGWPLLMLLFCATLGFALILKRRGVPAAYFLAGFFLSGFGHLTTLTSGAVPLPLTLLAFGVIGTLIGSRFRGVSIRSLGAAMSAGVIGTLLASLIALAGGVLVSVVLNIPPAALFVAFAPGGLEVMIALAVQLGVEPAFVAAHHIARLLMLMALVPLMLRRL